jgi:hypothetical protein
MGLGCLECRIPLTDSVILCPACRAKNALIITIQMAYRKHVLNDDRVGWDELADRLQTVICESLGDPAFQVWLAEVTKTRDQR